MSRSPAAQSGAVQARRIPRRAGTVVVMLQARLGSERLPGKVLLPLAGESILRHCLVALRAMGAHRYLVVTESNSAEQLRPEVDDTGFDLYIGPERDVLQRFADAAADTGADTVVRATADAPLVSARLAERILRRHARVDADLSHYLGPPLGTGVEVISATALRSAAKDAVDPFEREHITQHLYRHRGRFRVIEPMCPRAVRDGAHVTVDDEESYALVKRIFGELHDGSPIDTRALVRWLHAS